MKITFNLKTINIKRYVFLKIKQKYDSNIKIGQIINLSIKIIHKTIKRKILKLIPILHQNKLM